MLEQLRGFVTFLFAQEALQHHVHSFSQFLAVWEAPLEAARDLRGKQPAVLTGKAEQSRATAEQTYWTYLNILISFIDLHQISSQSAF